MNDPDLAVRQAEKLDRLAALEQRSFSAAGRYLLRLCLGLFVLVGTGCATLDFDQHREPSYALTDTDDTSLGERVSQQAARHPGKSGFTLINDGIDALAARVILAALAERSIDAQYYFVLNDLTGMLFVRELLAAADRGVRVRLLLDDIATQGYDLGLSALDSHPNFEIRIFNPFSLRTGRYLNVRDFARVNRRMHNKSFIVDNQALLVGGRNIGDEYFAAREDMNFADMDVFGVGPVARDGSAVFDAFWNDRHSLPVLALVDKPTDPAAAMVALRKHIEESLRTLESSPYADALVNSELDVIGLAPEKAQWVPYRLVSDPPSKAWEARDSTNKLVEPIADVITAAEEELILISPYFVPRKEGEAMFSRIRENGVQVHILTNSLASTDVSAVHSGYAPSRKPLLESGVKLYEVRADAENISARRGGIEGSRASLHTKGFVVDREKVFFGSFNFDPRSAYINTEMGIFMRSPEMARRLATGFTRVVGKGQSTYEVFLNEEGRVRWLDRSGDTPVVLNKEPQTSLWQRFMASFLSLLPIKGQL